ncbi:MAG: hypothetical protein WBE58_08325 [Verrucomicrobiales bacterium]
MVWERKGAQRLIDEHPMKPLVVGLPPKPFRHEIRNHSQFEIVVLQTEGQPVEIFNHTPAIFGPTGTLHAPSILRHHTGGIVKSDFHARMERGYGNQRIPGSDARIWQARMVHVSPRRIDVEIPHWRNLQGVWRRFRFLAENFHPAKNENFFSDLKRLSSVDPDPEMVGLKKKARFHKSYFNRIYGFL